MHTTPLLTARPAGILDHSVLKSLLIWRSKSVSYSFLAEQIGRRLGSEVWLKIAEKYFSDHQAEFSRDLERDDLHSYVRRIAELAIEQDLLPIQEFYIDEVEPDDISPDFLPVHVLGLSLEDLENCPNSILLINLLFNSYSQTGSRQMENPWIEELHNRGLARYSWRAGSLAHAKSLKHLNQKRFKGGWIDLPLAVKFSISSTGNWFLDNDPESQSYNGNCPAWSDFDLLVDLFQKAKSIMKKVNLFTSFIEENQNERLERMVNILSEVLL